MRKILRKNVRKILRKNVRKILRKNVRKILRKNEVNYYTLPPKERTEGFFVCYVPFQYIFTCIFMHILRTFFTYIFYVKMCVHSVKNGIITLIK